jgi:PPP family 3-phenylpropionic acid transporter
MPFLVLHYEQLGLSGSQIGLLTGIQPLITLLSASVWGGLADARQKHGTLLRLAIIGAIGFVLLLSFITSFLWLIPVVIGYAFFVAPITPLVDNSVLAMLGDRTERYGKIRLWGAIGWGLIAPLAGRLIEQFGLGLSFYIYMGVISGALIVAWQMPIAPASIGAEFGRGLRSLVKDTRWLIFLATIFLAGMSSAFVHSYLYLYLADLGANNTLIGFSLTVATLSEFVIFFFSERLLAQLGTRRLIMLSLTAQMIRLLAYSFIHNPWLALGVQLLHGPHFSAMWVAGVAYVNKIAPKGMGATAQGLFTGIYMGLGSATGAVVGGFLLERVGSMVMFRYAAGWSLLALLLFVVAGRSVSIAEPEVVQSKS